MCDLWQEAGMAEKNDIVIGIQWLDIMEKTWSRKHGCGSLPTRPSFTHDPSFITH